jgi:hypothetical protein
MGCRAGDLNQVMGLIAFESSAFLGVIKPIPCTALRCRVMWYKHGSGRRGAAAMGTTDEYGRKVDRLLAELPDRSAAGQGLGRAPPNLHSPASQRRSEDQTSLRRPKTRVSNRPPTDRRCPYRMATQK